MTRIARFAVLVLCAVLTTTTPIAQTLLYKSVGPDGKIVYSDRAPTEGRLEKTMKFENLPNSPLPASATSQIDILRKAKYAFTPNPSSARTGEVVLYSADWCGYCRKAKAYLASNRIAYHEVDIDTDNGKADFARTGGGKGIPLLLAGGQRVQGFSTAAYDSLFGNRK